VIEGASETPVYLWIQDGEVELRDASHLWGQFTADAQATIRDELGDDRVRVAQIGPAGERLSPIAAVMHDINRAAGRTGLGAVMGSKNLKAVAVRGTGQKELADPDGLRDVARWFAGQYKETWAAGLQENGTANGLVGLHETGGLPTRNFKLGHFEGGADAISGQTMTATVLKERDTCFSCPVRCKRVVEITEGRYEVDPVYGGPEYETLGAFGSSCAVDDLAAVSKANELCNAYGLDTISCGVSIAWAMEAFERELLSTGDTGGIDLSFGNGEAMVEMVRLMGEREGFGELLSKGAHRAAQELGMDDDFVIHAKGQEVPMHEPRIKVALGLGYAMSPTGADHMHNIHDTGYIDNTSITDVKPLGVIEPLPAEDLSVAKVRLATRVIAWQTLCNALGFCMFVSSAFQKEKTVEMVRAITGWNTSAFELAEVGERAYTLARAFNAREGFTAEQDRIPHRFFEAFDTGPSQGNALSETQFEQARAAFYDMFGYDETSGAPMTWKLQELDIDWVSTAMAAGD
jgi:aldehyde:ferredoxin oxidoreductase